MTASQADPEIAAQIRIPRAAESPRRAHAGTDSDLPGRAGVLPLGLRSARVSVPSGRRAGVSRCQALDSDAWDRFADRGAAWTA